MKRKTKIWVLKYYAGSRKKVFVTQPKRRKDAIDDFNKVANLGWRAWVEHNETGVRICESEEEKCANTQS